MIKDFFDNTDQGFFDNPDISFTRERARHTIVVRNIEPCTLSRDSFILLSVPQPSLYLNLFTMLTLTLLICPTRLPSFHTTFVQSLYLRLS
uniref:Uncharacterized protein n=1 Tax=Meloidogyne incognita TaxID=6306 RepID=A0A914MKF1_MELIC